MNGMSVRLNMIVAALLLSGTADVVEAQRFFPDDPLWTDRDRIPIPRPYARDLSQIVDFLQNTFENCPQEGEYIPPSENVNSLGGVPDSTWFANRIGRRPMTVAELVRGPNTGEGPDSSGPWSIVRAKSQGVSPGFTIRDAAGDIYFIKFDPKEHPQLATSTEVIATKFFHAFGYHVPQNYLTMVRPERLAIDPAARVTDALGKQRRMKPEDIDEILRKVARRPDGSIQAVASLALKGAPLGPFRYFGTRSDDANDIFRHEHRRELRGLRVFAAWLNHDDARSINSLDTFMAQGDRGYVMHQLIDFGSCLGSGSVKPQSRRAGHEYILEWEPLTKAALSFGLWDRPWRDVDYPRHPGIGRFEADYFQPHQWKPEYPNPAFERMLPEDAFWAARIVQRFSREMIEALVGTGELAAPEAERYLIDTLVQRQRKILNFYLSQVNPLDDFQLESGRLTFVNAGLQAGLADAARYRYQWFGFDNQTEETALPGTEKISATESIPVPDSDQNWLMVRVITQSKPPHWSQPIYVYIRNQTPPQVVGIERGEEKAGRDGPWSDAPVPADSSARDR